MLLSSLAHIKTNGFCCTAQQVNIPLLCSESGHSKTQPVKLLLHKNYIISIVMTIRMKQNRCFIKLVAIFEKKVSSLSLGKMCIGLCNGLKF